MRIGLLGGSFDPVHRAHIALAQAALTQMALDEVQLLPAKQPWQKPSLSASTDHRLAMLALAVGARPGLRINDIELSRPGKTYTIDTLEALAPEHEYFWLLGADQLKNLPTWHRWQEVVSRVTLAVVDRPGTQLEIPLPLQHALQNSQASLIHLEFEPMAISSTLLRQALAHRTSGDASPPHSDWLEPAVARYIEQHQLYQTL
jgi:nicotinate-nucleotide adenylyltransferase